MSDDVIDDLAEDLHAQLRKDPDVLHKNATLYEAVMLACAENGYQWSKCQRVMREAKIPRDFVKKIKHDARKVLGVASIGEPSMQPRVVETSKGAPVSEQAEIPRGWGVNGQDCAIYKEVERTVDGLTMIKQMPISYEPIFIRRRIKHEEQHSIMLELVWRSGKRWYTGIYGRDEVYKKTGLVAAAADGAPVRDDNALSLVEFIGAYENHNLAHIEHGYASSSMGWKGSVDDPTADGFLCGKVHMCKSDDARSFMLRPMGPGDEEEAKTVRACGTFERWKTAIAKVAPHAAVRIALYGGFSSVMLPILGAPNMIIEWVGGTSTGKTRVLQIVQSLFKSSMTPLVSWDNTVSNFESRAHLSSGLPFFVDDTKAVVSGKGGVEVLGKTIYKFINGTGRGRDQRSGGQRSTITWRCVMFSTGETPSSDLVHAEGAAARVLSFWTKPWGKSDPTTGAMIDSLVEIELAENYGHAGPKFVQWMHDNRDKWDMLRASYDDATQKIRDTFKSRAADRLARVIALLEVTAACAHAAGLIPWAPRSLLEDPEIQALMRVSIKQAEVGADDAIRAWEYVLSEAESRRANWIEWGFEPNHNIAPSSGWLGWRSSDRLGWNPASLKRALEAGGFTNDAILRAWKERGMIDPGSGRSAYGKNTKIGTDIAKRTVRLVCMRLDEADWHPESEDLSEEMSAGPDVL